MEGVGEHPWVPGTPWVGWELLFFGCWESIWDGCAVGCTFGCQGLTWGGGHWEPLGAGGTLGWRAGESTLGCWGLTWGGGHWVPLGAGVPLGWRSSGCILGCQGPHGLGGSCFSLGAKGPHRWLGTRVHLWVPGTPLGLGGLWVPLGAGVPIGWRAWGCTLGCWGPHGLGGHWVSSGAEGPQRRLGTRVHLWVPGTHLGWWALGALGCRGPFT